MTSRRSLLMSLALAVTALLGLAMPSVAKAEPPKPGAIAVLVVDADGKPVVGALVEVRHRGQPVRHERTDADGKALFRGLRPGEYGVSAGKIDVGRGRAPARVMSEKAADVKITLKKR